MNEIDKIYKDWCGESHLTNSCHPVHDSAEACDFAEYYHKIKSESKQTKPTKIEVLPQYKNNEQKEVHFKTENNIPEFSDCIGTICNRHLIHQKFNRVYHSENPKDYTDYPIYMDEHQIRKTETDRYTSDVNKVTCLSCLLKLKKK